MRFKEKKEDYLNTKLLKKWLHEELRGAKLVNFWFDKELYEDIKILGNKDKFINGKLFTHITSDLDIKSNAESMEACELAHTIEKDSEEYWESDWNEIIRQFDKRNMLCFCGDR